MIQCLTGRELQLDPILRNTMHMDRAEQFASRLGWQVHVDESGREIDEYDTEKSVYIIWRRSDGMHGGSIRLLPTMGPNMFNDHFSFLIEGNEIRSPFVWECTRLCIRRNADSRIYPALVCAAFEFGQHAGIHSFIGVFNAPMLRLYRNVGWTPIILGSQEVFKRKIYIGLWSFDNADSKVLTNHSI